MMLRLKLMLGTVKANLGYLVTMADSDLKYVQKMHSNSKRILK
jgi:hypothetical protein